MGAGDGTRKRAEEWLAKPLGRCAKVSKFYREDESRTCSPVWWFDIQVERVSSGECTDMSLLCEASEGFCQLKVPCSFFLKNRDHLVVEMNKGQDCYRLHLSARDEDRFVDLRGPGNVDFSQWLVEKDGGAARDG